MNLREYVREIPDFPKPGIPFKDITPIFLNPDVFNHCIWQMVRFAADCGATMVAGIESRGFLFAAPVAHIRSIPLTILRKPGKLPYKTYKASYKLEYGEAELHVHQDIPREKVLLIDDVLATGGTVAAASEVLKEAGCEVVGCAFLIELLYLRGREKLSTKIRSLIEYD